MGSTRLPGKVLADIERRADAGRIVARVRRSRLMQKVIVATSTTRADDRSPNSASTKMSALFRGTRPTCSIVFTMRPKRIAAEVIVRITGDCPLIDPEVIDRVIGAFLSDDCDYASNTLVCTYPDGLDTEVFSFAALEIAWRDARRVADREHVTPYLRTSRHFRLHNVESDLGRRSTRHCAGPSMSRATWNLSRAIYERLRGA